MGPIALDAGVVSREKVRDGIGARWGLFAYVGWLF